MRVAVFRCFILLMTAGKKKKHKSTDLSSSSFSLVGEANEMRGSEMKTEGNRQIERSREREKDQREELNFTIEEEGTEKKSASHCGDPPPHLPTSTPSNAV